MNLESKIVKLILSCIGSEGILEPNWESLRKITTNENSLTSETIIKAIWELFKDINLPTFKKIHLLEIWNRLVVENNNCSRITVDLNLLSKIEEFAKRKKQTNLKKRKAIYFKPSEDNLIVTQCIETACHVLQNWARTKSKGSSKYDRKYVLAFEVLQKRGIVLSEHQSFNGLLINQSPSYSPPNMSIIAQHQDFNTSELSTLNENGLTTMITPQISFSNYNTYLDKSSGDLENGSELNNNSSYFNDHFDENNQYFEEFNIETKLIDACNSADLFREMLSTPNDFSKKEILEECAQQCRNHLNTLQGLTATLDDNLEFQNTQQIEKTIEIIKSTLSDFSTWELSMKRKNDRDKSNNDICPDNDKKAVQPIIHLECENILGQASYNQTIDKQISEEMGTDTISEPKISHKHNRITLNSSIHSPKLYNPYLETFKSISDTPDLIDNLPYQGSQNSSTRIKTNSPDISYQNSSETLSNSSLIDLNTQTHILSEKDSKRPAKGIKLKFKKEIASLKQQLKKKTQDSLMYQEKIKESEFHVNSLNLKINQLNSFVEDFTKKVNNLETQNTFLENKIKVLENTKMNNNLPNPLPPNNKKTTEKALQKFPTSLPIFDRNMTQPIKSYKPTPKPTQTAPVLSANEISSVKLISNNAKKNHKNSSTGVELKNQFEIITPIPPLSTNTKLQNNSSTPEASKKIEQFQDFPWNDDTLFDFSFQELSYKDKKNILRFKNLLSSNQALLYEDENIQIGLMSKYIELRGKIALIIENKTSLPLQNFDTTFLVSEETLHFKISPIADLIEPYQRLSQELIVQCLGPFEDFPLLRLEFLLPDSLEFKIDIYLPICIAKFFFPIPHYKSIFFDFWNDPVFEKHTTMMMIKLKLDIINNLSKLLEFAGLGGNLSLCFELAQSSKELIFIGSMLSKEVISTQSQFFTVLVRLELGKLKYKEFARITTRSNNLVISNATCTLICLSLSREL